MIDKFNKYQLYHAWRRYAKKISWETQLMDQGKIEGAYLLLKRFKNRLKLLDDALAHISDHKVDRAEFTLLEKSLEKNKA